MPTVSVADVTEIPCDKTELLKSVEDHPDKKIGQIGSAEVWRVYKVFKPQSLGEPLRGLESLFACDNLEFRKKSGIKSFNLESHGISPPEQPYVVSIKIQQNLVIVRFGDPSRMSEEGDGKIVTYKYNDKQEIPLKEVSRKAVFPQRENRKAIGKKLRAVKTEKELISVIQLFAKLDKDPFGGHSLSDELFMAHTPIFLQKMKMLFGSKVTGQTKFKTSKIVSDYLYAIILKDDFSSQYTAENLGLFPNEKADDDRIKLWRQLLRYLLPSKEGGWKERIESALEQILDRP
jgi:hypothetical protein